MSRDNTFVTIARCTHQPLFGCWSHLLLDLADVEIYSKENFLVAIISLTLESAHVHVVGIDKFLDFILPLIKRRGFFGNDLLDYKYSPAIFRQSSCTKLFRNPMLALP
jgi:hypothetical protein